MAYTPKNPNGQATMSASEPVVIASDQSAIPVTATNLDVQSGGADLATSTQAAAIETAVEAIQAAQLPDGHNVTVDNASIAVTGTFRQATQPVSGSLTVDLGANNDVTVTGTVDLGATDNAVLDDIAAKLGTIDNPVQVLGTDTYTEATSSGITIGAVRRDADTTLVNTTNEFGPLQMDANGRLKVEVFSGETLPVSGTVTANLAAGTNNIGDVDILSIAAGDNNIGNVDVASIAAGDNNIGNVDIVTMPATAVLGTATYTEATTVGLTMGAVRRDADTTLVNTTNEIAPLIVDANGYLKVEVFDGGGTHTVDAPVGTPVNVQLGNGTLTQGVVDETGSSAVDAAAVGGGTPHDSVDSGNPIKVGFKAYELDGTAPQTAVAEADRVNGISDLVGRQYTATEHPRFWHVSADYASAQTNVSVQASPGAGVALYITDIMISNGATAGNITLLNGSGGTVLFEIYPAINGGVVCNLRNPIKLSDATALCLTSTTVTTHSITVGGFID